MHPAIDPAQNPDATLPSVAIGVHVHAQPHDLRATLAALHAGGGPACAIVLLPDGPDEAVRAALRGLAHLPQYASAEPRGVAACFNRLAANTTADVLVLLESGALVAPRWLDHLLAAFAADPRCGLAGPSTNRCWNEQQVFPHSGGSPAAIAATGRLAERQFGAEVRDLAPLYSLAEFCYAVRRPVIDAIGAADEGYGVGPCWEMDYNIRAARAGFRGVWACTAYVHRLPFPPRRRRDEQAHFDAARRRYQDKFCALHLRGQRTDYEPHCRGDACEHFAPAALIQITEPFPPAPSLIPAIAAALLTPPPIMPGTPVLPPAPSPAPPALTQPIPTPPPLVSCIMPTGGRAAYALQSIRYFARQDYPRCELIVADDGDDGLEAQLPPDPRIRYLRLPRGLSIGAKRNRACAAAGGDLIAQWDDDDWYAPGRLSAQVAPLLAGAADITGLRAGLFFELEPWAFWRCTAELHRRLFYADVHGGTLVFRRRVWEQMAQYPDRSLAEDAIFLQSALRRGAHLLPLDNQELFIYLRHARNVWAFRCGHFLDPHGWLRSSEPAWPPADRAFYAGLTAAQPPPPLSSSPPSSPPAASPVTPPVTPPVTAPLVSCIMPTAGRRAFAVHAIRYFQRQDYPQRELIILDDGADSIADLVPADPAIRYVRLDRRHTIGAKRNLACAQARGEIILHWDDDDWMASWRISYQVAELLRSGADLCGLVQLIYFDPAACAAWQYTYGSGGRPWVAGNTLCYRRSLWQRSPFPDINIGEDTRFVWSREARKLLALPDSRFFVALLHGSNTGARVRSSAYWTRWQGDLRAIMGPDLDLYAPSLAARV